MAIRSERTIQLQRLAEDLAKAWPHNAVDSEVQECPLPQDREEAYFVQDKVADLLGHSTTGWKAGATSARMRELDGHDDIIPGRIFALTTWRGTNVRIKAELPLNARVEAEFAFRLNADLPLRAEPWRSDELADAAILHPAIEIIGDRLRTANLPTGLRSLATVADNGGGFGFVSGDPAKDWQNFDFLRHQISLRVGSGPTAPNIAPEDRCDPLQALADLANLLSKRSIPLREGMYISTGAATVPQPINKGCTVTADFGNLGTIRVEFN